VIDLPVEWFDAPEHEDPDFDAVFVSPRSADPSEGDMPSALRPIESPWAGYIRCGTCHPELVSPELLEQVGRGDKA